MNRNAAFLFLLILIPIPVIAQTPKTEPFAAPSGWSIATEGSGIPVGQSASDYAAELDRKVTHGGQAAMSLRSVVAKPARFRAVSQFVKADVYRGKRVCLAGYLKTRDVADWSGLWLRVDGPGRMLAFDNMDSRPVKGTTDWKRYEVVLDVPAAALRVAFGPVLRGAGEVWADDLTLDVVDSKMVKSTQPPPYDMNPAEHASNLDFEATGGNATNPIPGWNASGFPTGSYASRIADVGAHGGRAFLEIKSTQQGRPSAFSAYQNIAGSPYKGKRVRFRAYLKTEGVVEKAYVWVWLWTKQSGITINTSGQELKGQTDWRPQEVVFDVPADAEGLSMGAVLRGVGTLGVDDASVDAVDPSKVPVTPETEGDRTAREKRSRELSEAYAKLPDRPANLDFER